ncbi:MAG: hypothetical protein H9W81_18400 [Enterococcus sp.]|nr:hypothetical protein [Enterococcus sp.]
MTNAANAKALMENFVSAETALKTAMAPHLQEWLELEVKLGNLTRQQIEQEFRFRGLSYNGEFAIYESDTWVDNYNEIEFGSETLFPLAFLTESESFYDKVAHQVRQKEEREREIQRKRVERDRIRLERELAQLLEVQQELNSENR